MEKKLGKKVGKVGKGCGTRDVISASSQLPNSGLREPITVLEKGAWSLRGSGCVWIARQPGSERDRSQHSVRCGCSVRVRGSLPFGEDELRDKVGRHS